MTSDTKIGLLLGLVFIFVIAFLINGMPDFRRAKDPNQLIRNWVESESQMSSVEVAAREKQAVQRYMEPVGFRFQQTAEPVDDTVRATLPLPAPTAQITEQAEDVVKEVRSQKEVQVSNASLLQKKEALRRLNQPKVYTVEEGDNLAKIAKRFYGSELGNKVSTIQALFEVNRKTLPSMDKIVVGQTLVIPKINSASTKTLEDVTERVKSVATPEPVNKETPTPENQWYVVRENDTLWDIASSMLGSGSRYTEIARLNASLLRDEDSIKAGMKLRLPNH